MALKPKLRSHREAIAALEADGMTVTPVRYSRGDHLILEVSGPAGTIRLTVSGSPGGLALKNVVGEARRRLRPIM